jgi:hypothetical protein
MFAHDLDPHPDLFPGTVGFGEASLYHAAQSRGFFAHIVRRWHSPRAGRPYFGMFQRSHRISSLPYVIDHADPRLDNYISQAEFFKPNRRVVNLLRMSLNFVDLDFYAVDPGRERFATHTQMAWVVRYFCADEGIPPPSLVAFSGRGLYYVPYETYSGVY